MNVVSVVVLMLFLALLTVADLLPAAAEPRGPVRPTAWEAGGGARRRSGQGSPGQGWAVTCPRRAPVSGRSA